MSAQRDALEAAQARLRELESGGVADAQLHALAEGLEREAGAWEVALERGEQKALRKERSGQSARLMSSGFALLFVTPIVVMAGVSLSRSLRHQHEVAVLCLIGGGVLIGLTRAGPGGRRRTRCPRSGG